VVKHFEEDGDVMNDEKYFNGIRCAGQTLRHLRIKFVASNVIGCRLTLKLRHDASRNVITFIELSGAQRRVPFKMNPSVFD